MADIREYLKNLREEYKPQPETDLTVKDTLEMLSELGVNTDD